MVIYVLDPSFNLVGVVDDYISVIWRPAYYDVGDFEIYARVNTQNLSLLHKDYYVVRSTDITVENGVATYKKVMIIKNIQIDTNVETGNHLIVTGRELKYLLHQRIVWGQRIIRDNVEYVIRRLIGSNAESPAEPTRTIPNMTYAEPLGIKEPIEIQVSNKQLDEAVTELCQTYGYGWDIYISNNKLVVEIYKGLDRSYNQSERGYVVFSDEFNNLHETEYKLATENYANMTLVGGEGEGSSRIYAYVNNEVAGLDRYEVFTDARDISQNLDSEDAISYEEYLLLLEQRGLESLAENSITESFTGEVINDLNFIYGKDFYLGDIVTVINQYGISQNVRITSAIESVDDTGTKFIPQFNM